MNLKHRDCCITKTFLILILLVVALYNLNAVPLLADLNRPESRSLQHPVVSGEARESISLQDEQCAMTSTTPDSRGGIQLFQTVEIYPPPRPTPTPTPKVAI
jgi:hypothetical protein